LSSYRAAPRSLRAMMIAMLTEARIREASGRNGAPPPPPRRPHYPLP
jgi:hypothetical protein